MRTGIGPLLAATVVIGVAGVIHGIQTDRWRPSAQLEQALGRMDHVPETVGDWRGEPRAFDADDMARAGIQKCVFRTYLNARTREDVMVLLVCGRGGPISVHTPEVCYTTAGYQQHTDARKKDIGLSEGRRATFWAARFTKPGVVPANLEIYWAWSRDGQSWEAPENARAPFARLPALYKLYVVRSFIAGTREEKADSCQDFLRRALPEFGQALAASD